MKTRVKKRGFDTVKDTDLIGIVWNDYEKGVLIETGAGVISMNNDDTDLTSSVPRDSKSLFLVDEEINKDLKKVYVFENMRSLLKWFAKK